MRASPDIRGGQTSADRALAGFSVSGYAARRSQVLPETARGASRLSPYIRHSLLPLRRVWQHVADGPARDARKFRDELLWQEYARHLYARVGVALHRNLRFAAPWDGEFEPEAWPRRMHCVDSVLSELETDGWLVNQTRMWLASQYTVRSGAGWHAGQEVFYRHLLDGSRAANLLGWQWTVGAGTGAPYGFARWQVEKRAPQLCRACPLARSCPIEQFPADSAPPRVTDAPGNLTHDPHLSATSGPASVLRRRAARSVLLTVDSLGDADPALRAHPELPAVFVFDEPALARLRLSSKRLIFTVETLQDLARRREVIVHLGDPRVIVPGLDAAVTFAPVPSFTRYAEGAAELHPWPWLVAPHSGSVASFSAWRRALVDVVGDDRPVDTGRLPGL
ncbi:deoxyribodipyrimidine photolyase [Cryobacterium sinapicolor]|uniref:Deoxyribodipyrimidine photolyase n=1 Tax=Cryobacterium sinapicolor TaxID=1259236 RepID=A0ABY2IT96_9MICO|nr:deoxyribodipyrimidine photolyase [Cryobacterium sp. TMT3-29-2]TFC94205.1 deoxyribodipyrimidine photolyase [Cryobacterium sinapicolor]